MALHGLELFDGITAVDVLIVLVGVNICAFAAFGIDKARAARGKRRIREATLLRWALVGGTPGAFAGRKLFRHKTRKQPFNAYLLAIALAQAAALIGWLALSYAS